MKWIDNEFIKPIPYKTGDWDGKMTDRVLVLDENKRIRIAVAYEGFIDGSYFFEWYDDNDFSIIEIITHWMPLPDAI